MSTAVLPRLVQHGGVSPSDRRSADLLGKQLNSSHRTGFPLINQSFVTLTDEQYRAAIMSPRCAAVSVPAPAGNTDGDLRTELIDEVIRNSGETSGCISD